MQQLTLQFPCDEHSLRECLEKKISRSISLIVTDNSASMLSVKDEGGAVTVRLHRIFLSAGAEVLGEIAGFIKNKKGRTPHIRDFINRNTHRLRRRPPKSVSIHTRGECYDLSCIFNSLNEKYFKGNISSSITWGRSCQKRMARKRTLGSYSHHGDLIRINPLLDRKSVPQYFLEYIVYHEMLHADIGAGVSQGRRTMHTKEFREREKLFSHYSRALQWEKKRWGE
jgi:predicted SprT family Zn-dependent metalloprotease